MISVCAPIQNLKEEIDFSRAELESASWYYDRLFAAGDNSDRVKWYSLSMPQGCGLSESISNNYRYYFCRVILTYRPD